MTAPLYRTHSTPLAAAYATLEKTAKSQPEVLAGTPGAITLRSNAAGMRFYVRQYYDAEGRKRDQYLAAAPRDPQEERRLDDLRKRLQQAKEARACVRLLAREGFATVGPRHFAAVAALDHQEMFHAGAVLVGTHGFGVIANRMGIRTAAFAAEHVDIAGPAKLALESLPEGVRLAHAESAPDAPAEVAALPLLRYLLASTQDGAVLSSHGIAAVRVPLPERFALHKLLLAQLRGRPQESAKDLQQAAALIAALGDLRPGALEAGYRGTPVAARRLIRTAIRQLAGPLKPHPRAWEELTDVAKA